MLEQLFSVKWLRGNWHTLVISFAYALIAISSSILIFPDSAGIMSIAFTAILLIPTCNILLRMEERLEIRETKLDLGQLFRDHKVIFKIYFSMFLGVFLAYFAMMLILPKAGFFSPQLSTQGISGMAFQPTVFRELMWNNLLVLLVSFVLSLAYGAGSIIFLTWNASVWGVVFAYFAWISFSSQGSFADILPSMPHMVTEALAYISAAISGGVVSRAVLKEKLRSDRFRHVFTDALLMLVIGFCLVFAAGFMEAYVI